MIDEQKISIDEEKVKFRKLRKEQRQINAQCEKNICKQIINSRDPKPNNRHYIKKEREKKQEKLSKKCYK